MADQQDKHVIHSGTKYDVRCLVLGDGTSPALDFWLSLTEGEQTKLIVWFAHLANGSRITNDTKFKKVEGTEVFEFKSHQIRIFCFYNGNSVILTNGVRKKTDKHKKQDIARAEEYRRWYLGQQEQPGKKRRK